jgi:ubiquinone/menaquinone biosynthesis C-methylase UbiE
MSIIHHSNCPICESTQIETIQSIKDHSHTGEDFPLVKCGQCDFYFTQDIPDQESIAPYYKSENYVSHSDTQKGLFFKVYHSVRSYMLKKKKNLVEGATSKKQGNLLDIGTGTGYFPSTMINGGWTAEGVEQDPDTRKYAAEKFNFTVHDTPELYNLSDNSFDAITMWHVLEHVHDLNEYVKKIYGLLKADGKFIVAVPNHKSFDAKHYGSSWAAWDIPIHLWHFHPESMKNLMEKHKFKVEKIIPMPFDAAYVSMLSEQYKSGSKLPGLIKGVWFALKGKLSPEKCSSVIYVIGK